jgi:beta-galactosidase
VLLGVIQLAGLAGPDQSLPSSVRVKHGLNRKNRALHYYLNYSSDPQTFTYAYGAGTDLLTQAAMSHSQAMTLKPWDAAIVEEK